MERRLVPYTADTRRKIRDGDVLLFRHPDKIRTPRDFLSYLISIGGRSEYSHAAMAKWWDDSLMSIGMDFGGGNVVTLSSQVNRYPGRIDVYHFAGDLEIASAASRKMVRFGGTPYGWISLGRVALVHVPLVRLFIHPNLDDAVTSNQPPLCSEAICNTYRETGIDLVKNLADCSTEPGDLNRATWLEYDMTLIPESALAS